MSNKTAIVFSHFDAKNEIDEYVFYSLEKFREITDKIIFVSDCPTLKYGDIRRAKKIVSKLIIGRHNAYDFGSYKRGFSYLVSESTFEDIDRLIFANDSVFGPITALGPILDEMGSRPADFWGMTFSERGFVRDGTELVEAVIPHLQSYFLVFKRNVFSSHEFQRFMSVIRPKKDKFDVILKYELGLTSFLADRGFRYDSYVPKEVKFEDTHSIFKLWRELVFDYGMPFIKYQAITVYHADYSVLKDRYPIKFITANTQKRNRIEKTALLKRKLVRIVKRIRTYWRCKQL